MVASITKASYLSLTVSCKLPKANFNESGAVLLLVRSPVQFGTDSEQSSAFDAVFVTVKFLRVTELRRRL